MNKVLVLGAVFLLFVTDLRQASKSFPSYSYLFQLDQTTRTDIKKKRSVHTAASLLEDFHFVNSTLDILLEDYQNSTSPVKDLLKVYVYDNLPYNLSGELEEFMTSHPNSNFVGDRVLFQLFRSFPGRTYNADEADIFVVPYAHRAHCAYAEGYLPWCKHLPYHHAKTAVFSHLKYHNASTAHRHLFFLADGQWQAHKWIVQQPLVAMYGNKWLSSPPGHILIPPFNPSVQFQPSMVTERLRPQQQQQNSAISQQPSKNKNYSLTMVAGFWNPRMRWKSARRYRKYFLDALKKGNPEGMIGGMPYIASGDTKVFAHEQQQTYPNTTLGELLYGKYYPQSIVCPVLPGDCAWQRRFFDVMGMGCLPMVVSYPMDMVRFNATTGGGNRTSWYVPNQQGTFNVALEENYPYVDSIDYRSFTVECPCNVTNPDNMVHVVPECLEPFLNNTAAIRQKQEALRNEVIKLMYGLGPDAHRYEDAFAQLIRQLRRYLDDYNDSKAGNK
ncbi:MAG: hypothetical protein SGILL_001870 [Bacillariaceae sp.]